MSHRLSLTLSALAALVATPALAGPLHTPFSFVGGSQTPYCIVTNVGTKAIEVDVSATSIGGGLRAPIVNNCPVPPNTLSAGATCFSYYADGATLSCHFTAKGKVRAALQILDGSNNVVDTIPATAK